MSSDPGWLRGYIPTAAEWNSWFARKLDNDDPLVAAGPFLPVAGGTMTGLLTLSADPSSNLNAATKQYTDGAVARAGGPFLQLIGGVLSGALVLAGNPANALEAAPKQYVDAISGAIPIGSAALPLMNGTALAGVGTSWSRFDHVHPVDTSRYAAANPAGYQTAAQVSAVLPVGSSTVPLMDGAAVIGVGATWARADHVHPVDTSRYAASNPAGYITAAGAAGAAPVQSVATRTGNVTLTHADITDWAATLAAYAPLASPVFTGTPSLPTGTTGVTQTVGNTTTALATTAFVAAAVAAGTAGVASFNTRTGAVVLSNADVIAVLPGSVSNPVMDGAVAVGVATTWARADHVHPVDTSRYAATNPSGYQTNAQVVAAIAGSNPGAFSTLSASGTVSGAGFSALLASYALLNSPTFTGTPTLPSGTIGFTQAVNTNTTALATTAFVMTQVPLAAAATPLMDGTGAVGTGVTWARADHVHPTDTTRYAATNPSGYQTAAQVTAAVPLASSSAPLMDGTVAIGTGTTWARADHVHPSDTSRVIKAGDTMTGALNGTQFLANNNVMGANGIFGENTFTFGLYQSGTTRYLRYNTTFQWTWDTVGGNLAWTGTGGSMWVHRATDNAVLALLNYVAGNGAYQNISDQRFKVDIRPTRLGLGAIMQIEPKMFRRKLYDSERPEIGFIAQELRHIIPEAVTRIGVELPDGTGGLDSRDPTMSVSLDPIVAALVNAVKELSMRLQAVENRGQAHA